MLKLLKTLVPMFFSFAWMNFSMSGCHISSIPIFAPLLTPPCFITSLTASMRCMNETGPEAAPVVVPTISPSGRSFEKLIPVPPPAFCIKATSWAAFIMLSMSSSIGTTKQAESIPRGLPELINAGVFGMKIWFVINLKYSSISFSYLLNSPLSSIPRNSSILTFIFPFSASSL
ncbi:173aa long hypothetical protein [Pyrococcus horikoshii OT3]|uniref:Uncharacterized protein n=1 Tax=Pyrococcus horikoshii (strain ATCC 700860 / DSM 12428 / JCM 9974 / NBRC 100139 / OT-3) TaxID=70601 RepID=O58102_PYRHO|nr:173aa long hypothetical protein [Pyrococcus horikoshii OT3]